MVGLIKKDNQLLVCEVLNDEGTLKGYAPLGGGIEFGEFAENALRREMLEELGCSIQVQGKPLVFENIFTHHDVTGHEIIFAFPVQLDNPEIYSRKRFQIKEEGGSLHWVEWINCDDLRTGKVLLYPQALRAHL